MTHSATRPDIQGRSHDELFHFAAPLAEVRRDHEYILPYFKGARSVLDLGCGRGVCLEMLREMGIQAAGIDLHPESVSWCQALGFTEVYEADAVEFLKSHPAAYDGVVCSHLIEHLPYPDAISLVRSAYAALAPGGHLALVTPNPRDLYVITELFWLDPTHVRPYPLPLLDAMLRATGFEIVFAARPVIRASQRSRARRLLFKLLPAQYFGRPNTYLVGRKPATS